MNKNDEPLNILLNKELSSIEFVRDYMQFRFDGPCLTAITDPYIIVDNKQYNRVDEGFCDLVLSLIGLQVRETLLIIGDIVCIRFSSDKSINISLKPNDYVTVEAVNFDDGQGGLWVW